MTSHQLRIVGYEVAIGDTGYFLGIEHLRYTERVYLRHDTREISALADRKRRNLCDCTKGERPLSPQEKAELDEIWCRHVVIWSVRWQPEYNSFELEDLGNKRELLLEFFNAYQGSHGVGCYENGTPKKAKIEVEFGGNRFERSPR